MILGALSGGIRRFRDLGTPGDVALHAAVVASIALLYGLTNAPALTLALGGALVLGFYAILAAKEAGRATFFLSPLSFYFAWYAIGLGGGALFYAGEISKGHAIGFSFAQVPPHHLTQGYLIFLAGSVALHAGIQLVRPVHDARPAIVGLPSPRTLAWVLAAIVWALGLWSMANPPWVLRLGFPARAFQWFPHGMLLWIVFAGPRGLRLTKSAYVTLVTVATLLLASAGLASGSKAIIMFGFVPALWGLVMSRRFRKYAPVAGAVLLASYLLVVAPFISTLRLTPALQDETPTEHMIRVAGLVLTGSAADDPESFAAVERLLSRLFDPVAIGYLVGEVEAVGHPRGATMEYATYSLIPRALWPDKPHITQGGWFAHYVGFSSEATGGTLSLGISATGELFWNFGLAGVLLGMFAIGIAIGGIWRLAMTGPASPITLTLLVATTLNMPNMAESVTTAVSLLAYAILFGAIMAAPHALRWANRQRATLLAERT